MRQWRGRDGQEKDMEIITIATTQHGPFDSTFLAPLFSICYTAHVYVSYIMPLSGISEMCFQIVLQMLQRYGHCFTKGLRTKVQKFLRADFFPLIYDLKYVASNVLMLPSRPEKLRRKLMGF